jgi:hypothetical protein
MSSRPRVRVTRDVLLIGRRRVAGVIGQRAHEQSRLVVRGSKNVSVTGLGGPPRDEQVAGILQGEAVALVAIRPPVLRRCLASCQREAPGDGLPSNGVHHPDLPRRLAKIIGRDDAIAVVSALVMESRFVSVFGAGGMGKTTVSLAVAHALSNRFDDAVYFVDLGTVRDGTIVTSVVASAVGCLGQAQDPIQELLTFVTEKRILILLDNCEHVINAAATLAERLFKEAPQVHLLTTTREALRVEGENLYQLLPLQGPKGDESTAEEVLASPAVQLFMDRAAASRPELRAKKGAKTSSHR